MKVMIMTSGNSLNELFSTTHNLYMIQNIIIMKCIFMIH